DEAVAAGKLTQDKADQILARAEQVAGDWVNSGKNPASPRCRRMFNAAVHWSRLAAEAIGMPARDFAKALAKCQTPAEIAEANGSSADIVVAAILADARSHLDQAVEDGKLSREEADRRLAETESRVTKWVHSSIPTPRCQDPS
ncbi:MAG: hypothetical protein D6775_13820, partial [Caldilineae bacterium]